jgi:hypothetical protein
LRYGIQPDHPGPGLVPGRCPSKAHDREHLGCGGRRVLVSRDWSGKTLREHKADRATVVREALDAAGMLTPDVERMAAGVVSPDGLPRFVWTDDRPDPTTYTLRLLRAVAEQQRWRAEYVQAKNAAGAVDSVSATSDPPGAGPPNPAAAHISASPDPGQTRAAGPAVKGERSESAGPSASEALDGRTEGPTLPTRGRPSTQPTEDGETDGWLVEGR